MELQILSIYLIQSQVVCPLISQSNDIINYSNILSMPSLFMLSYQVFLLTFKRYSLIYTMHKMTPLRVCLAPLLVILLLLAYLLKHITFMKKVQLLELYHDRIKWIKGSLHNCLISCTACRPYNTIFYSMANSFLPLATRCSSHAKRELDLSER